MRSVTPAFISAATGFRMHCRKSLPPLGSTFVAVVMAAVLAGCGSSAASNTSAPRASAKSSTPTPTAAGPVCATPTATLTGAAPPGGVGTYIRPRPPGDGSTSVLLLCADGTYLVDVGTGVMGQWKYADGKITLTETGGGACTGIAGTYTWTYDGSNLTLGLVSDRCQIRSTDTVAASYTKRG